MGYVVGIDLGTTHCALAYSPEDRPSVRVFDIPQLVAPGEIAARPLLPSFLYLPAPGELSDAHRTLPWGLSNPIVGEWARRLGARSPDRLVASSKSWICHGGVNRRAKILPWSAPDDEPHLSPFEASSHLLAHLRAAWDAEHPDAPLAEQDVVVTVPASFDGIARELTVDAARLAGLPQIRLLEEPQAALYDFLGAHQDDLTGVLGDAKLALVVDVGGGTTDLTLVRLQASTEPDQPPEIERIAVGGHLMLGGDNMDAALAHYVGQQAGLRGKLDPTEWSALVQDACRCKELLLGEEPPEQAVVSIQRRGSRLIGGTKSQVVRAEQLWKLLVDGFMPRTDRNEVPERGVRAGLTQLGLPYETDPAIPRHVNAFLRRHAAAAAEAGAEVRDGLPRPDLLLLNGGVFGAATLVDRFTSVLAQWFDGASIQLLPHTSLDTAVARGAVRFALAGRGFGLLITGGAARAYYVGIDDLDGAPRALCVVPRGIDEGSRVAVRDRVFDLLLGRRVSFPLYSTTDEVADEPGQLVDITDELEPLPPITTAFSSKTKSLSVSASGVPVTLTAELTEAGTLELYLATLELPPQRWRLEFDLAAPDQPSVPEPEDPPAKRSLPLPREFKEASRSVHRIFGTARQGRDPKAAKRLRVDLEEVLGQRGSWSSAVCRGLCDELLAQAEFRGRTPQHELSWLRLVGWCLRPGSGFDGDAARIEALWDLREAGLLHPEHKAGWGEWWILWRRVALGLDRGRQRALFEDVRPWLDPNGRPPQGGPRIAGHREMMRMLAAFEQLPAADKVRVGGWCIERFKKVGSWWALGRLGSRHDVQAVSGDVAQLWLQRVLALDWDRTAGAAFAAVLLAGKTTDASLDVADEVRSSVVRRLGEVGASEHWVRMVREGEALSDSDAKQLHGESLPSGLKLR